MSQENVELIREMYEAVSRGDVERALALADAPPEFEFVPTGVLIPDLAGVQRGPEGLRRLAEFVGEFDDPHIEAHELIDAGDQVFASVVFRGRGKQSGAETSWDFWHVWTLREGSIVRGQGFTDRDEALEAAGLREQGMSQENVEIARAAIDAANAGEWDAAFKDAAPNFEWDNSRAIGADNRAVWTADEAREFFKGMSDLWESAWIEINELIPTGDDVVVPHTAHVRGRDGIEAQARTTWLFTIRNGKIECICLYQDRQEALEAARLREDR